MWGSQSMLAWAPVFFHHWCHLCWAIPAKSGSVTRLGVRQAPRPVPRAGGDAGSLCPLRLRHQGYAQQQPPNNRIITGQRGGWVLQLQFRRLSSPNAWPRKQARGVWVGTGRTAPIQPQTRCDVGRAGPTCSHILTLTEMLALQTFIENFSMPQCWQLIQCLKHSVSCPSQGGSVG